MHAKNEQEPDNRNLACGDLLGFVMPSDRKEIYVEVFAQNGDPAFICGGDGHITGHLIDEIEKDLAENRADILDKGDGQYLFTVEYVEAQTDFEGRVELPAFWDLSFVAYQPLSTVKFRNAGEQGPSLSLL